jgi:sulfite exporter TauE/SafE
MVLAAFLLGLVGSLGHCVGMCSAVMLLIGRQGAVSRRRMLLVHLGRISAYALLGGLFGAFGYSIGVGSPHPSHAPGAADQHHAVGSAVSVALPSLRLAQGVLALLAAGLASYLALALLGRVPSPEIYLARLTRRWGWAMRRASARLGSRPLELYGAGLLWGLLPCGLVLTALLAAVAAGSPWRGALAMLAFGLGTWPALLGVGWLARRGLARPAGWPRQVGALLVLLIGAQMAFRGLAAWGWVGHLYLGNVMLW